MIDDRLNEYRIIILLGENAFHQSSSLFHFVLVWILVPNVPGIQRVIVLQFAVESFLDMSNQPIFVLRYIHFIEEVTQKLFNCPDLLLGNDFAFCDGSLANFALFPKHIRQLGIA